MRTLTCSKCGRGVRSERHLGTDQPALSALSAHCSSAACCSQLDRPCSAFEMGCSLHGTHLMLCNIWQRAACGQPAADSEEMQAEQ